MICYRCFQEHGEEKECAHCGYDKSKYVEKPQFLQTGTVLQEGRYIIGYSVGAGGFGITYSAWDNTLQQHVAIKEFLPGEFSTRTKGMTQVTIYGNEKEEQFIEGLNKFYDESKRLASLRGKNGIVQIYDCFMENNTAYLVMEYLEGETLGERLKREKKIPANEAVEIILPVLEALKSVHEKGILHRDIAPNNIFICENGEVKLLDFGASRSATGTHSKSLTVLYKEGHTPEEQYRSHGNQGPWTDVYACAATLYHAITGVVPESAMERKIKDNLKAPSKWGVKIDANVENAILNALNVDVNNRTQSALEFEKELLSEKQVDRHFIRKRNKDESSVPLWMLVVTGILSIMAMTFIGLIATGVIHVDSESFGNLFQKEGYTRVLNVVNMSEEAAHEKLSSVGLGLEVTEVKYSNKVAEGMIISQEEKKGESVQKGTIIHVVISMGAGIVQVPDMVGLKWDDVSVDMDELCLEYNVTEVESREAPGYVVMQSIEAGTEIEQGKLVEVQVSKGMSYDSGLSSEAEDLHGKMYEDEKQKLSEKGVYLQVEGYAYDDNIVAGGIISQTIPTGTILHGEDVQIVTVSQGLEPKQVPKLVGITKEEAVKTLEELQLKADISYVTNRDKQEGEVCGQSVAVGEFVDKYSTIKLEVISWGIEVPNLVGLSEADAIAMCENNQLTCSAQYVLSGNNTVKKQSIAAGQIVEQGSHVLIDIGITEDDFTNRLLEAMNNERSNAGVGKLTLSSDWCTSAKKLSDSGKTSADSKNDGYDFRWALLSYTYCFWATRNGITTPAHALQKLPSEQYLDSRYAIIGIAYNGTRIDVLFVEP